MAINVFAECLLRNKRADGAADDGDVGKGDVDRGNDEKEAEAREVLHVVTSDTLAEPRACG